MGQVILLAIAGAFLLLFWALLTDRKFWTEFGSDPIRSLCLLIMMVGLSVFLLWVSLGAFDHIRIGKIPLGLAGFITAGAALVASAIIGRK